MEFGDELLLKLEQYLTKTMEDAVKVSFEAEIAKSEDLQEFIAMYNRVDALEDDETWKFSSHQNNKLKETLKHFQSEETKVFSERIKRFREEDQQEKSSGLYKSALFVIMAACMAFLVYLAIPQEPDMAQLYTENSSWAELPSLGIKGDDTNQKLGVEKAFKVRNYQETIKLSSAILKIAPQTEATILLYKGVAHLELNQHNDALATFETLITSNHIDNHKGYWYKAMVYLNQGEKTKTIEALNMVVSNPMNYQYKQAQELLKELD